jgi:hypothetical protein
MFLDTKKGNIVAQFVVLIVIAVIMIFVVTAFGAKIWSSFFPNEDKSSLSSFEALFSVIEAKSVSEAQYDSTILNIYLKKDYNIAFFTDGKANCAETHWYGPTVTIFNAPSECETGKQCLCLYDGELNRNRGKEDKNLVKCHTIAKTMKIDRDYFYLNNGICGSPDRYNSYIIAKRIVTTTPYLYVLPDNEGNRTLDEKWKIPMCNTPSDRGSLCLGKSDESVVTFNDDINMTMLYDYCKKENIISTSIKCKYYDGTTGADVRGCKLDCDYGSITHETLRSCSNFNKNFGPNNEKYVSKNQNYRYYYMCDHDADYYKNGCDISQWNVYICKASVDGAQNDDCYPYDLADMCEASDGTNIPDCYVTKEYWITVCDIEYANADGLYSTDGKFIISYNINNANCKAYMDKNYYTNKGTVYACKSDIQGCRTFITTNKDSCSLKYMSANDNYWITYYDSKCDSQVKNLFEIAYFCTESNP